MGSERIIARYLIAKAVSLVPEFKKALFEYQQGDEKPIKALIESVIETILPGGGNVPPPWFNALGTAKRNALKKLVTEGRNLLNDISVQHPGAIRDPEKWRVYVTMNLEAWAKKLRTLEIASQATDEGRAIERGGFTIMPMPGITKKEADAALEALDEAASKIRSKFPEVLYGNVFFSTHLGAKVAAQYVYTDDTVHLSVRARKRFGDVYSLIHEFGHRYDNKFLKEQPKRLFWDLSTRKKFETVVYDEKLREDVASEAVAIAKARKEKKPFLGMTPELERWVAYPMNANWVKDSMADFLHGHTNEDELFKQIKGTHNVTIETDKLIHGPLSVTPYGATKPVENFAEAFAHFVLGMEMPSELQDIISHL